MNHRVNLNVDETRRPEHSVCLSSDEQVDPIVPSVRQENFQQPIPGRRRRVTEERSPVSFMAGDYASGPSQVDHFLYDSLWLGHIYQNEAGVNQIKGSSRQAGCFGVSLQHLCIP